MAKVQPSLVAFGACALLASASACQRSPAVPVSSELLDTSGDRIELASGESLDVGSGRPSSHHVKSLLNVQRRLTYGDYVWNERGVPAGKLWVLVDLSAQTLSVFRGEDEIGTTVLLYGTDHTPTPIGRFTVLQMDKDHRSSTYDAPMPYTLRLTADGVSIHGSSVRPRAGTHGCIGVPIEFAKRLFAEAKLGDEVLIRKDLEPSGRTT
jgi:L,D-transpeptidase catalytic domain